MTSNIAAIRAAEAQIPQLQEELRALREDRPTKSARTEMADMDSMM